MVGRKAKISASQRYTIGDIFGFADDLYDMEVDDHSILVSYDVYSLFTTVPVDETIEILPEKALF